MIIPMLQRELSIDDFVDPHGEVRREVFLADPGAENQVQRIHESEVADLIGQALVSLDQRERHIIRNRFGLLGGDEKTLEEIGQALSLSRERVRQLQCQAIKKLRPKLFSLRAHLG